MAKEIEGLAQLVANLRALPQELVGKGGGPIRKALYPLAKLIRDDARARVGYDEDGVGKHLREQIILKRDPNPRAIDNAAERYIVAVKYRTKKYTNNRKNRNAGRVGLTYQHFGDFYYWIPLEFGSSKMAPHPFMRPAFESNKMALSGMCVTNLAASIAQIVRKMPK